MQEPFFSSYPVFCSLLLVCIPFVIFIFLFLLPKYQQKLSSWFAISGTSICFLLSMYIFSQTWPDQSYTFQSNWFSVGNYTFEAGILIDKFSACMLVIVTLVSLLVQVYSVAYMKGDKAFTHYFAYLGLFTAAMLGIVLAGNLLILYVAWELVGVSSYLLIGFWREKAEAARAARNAFFINRIGDTGFLIGIILLYTQFHTLDIQILVTTDLSTQDTIWLTIAGLGLFSGCVAKSAQFPLQIWLPGAMAGPTPVSALIHAATMVAAGVFMLVRIFPLLQPEVLDIIAITGAITAFMGAFAALFQTDIKRLLAFSTISQLGYMVMGIGVGAYQASFFHLLTHAFFKACLFLSAGAIIHALHKAEHDAHTSFDTQDMRLMGGLWKKLPFTFVCYLLSGLALAGLPFFSGFLSKDAILLGALNWAESKGNLAWYLIPDIGFITALLTALYIGRQLILVFWGEFRLPIYMPHAEKVWHHINEVPFAMKLPMGILATLSVFIFFSFNPFDAAQGWFLANIQTSSRDSHNSWHVFTLITSALLSITGLVLAFFITNNPRIRKPVFIRNLSLHNWYLDVMYQQLFLRSGLAFTSMMKWIDTKIIDKIVDYAGIITVILAHITAWIDRTFVDGTVNLTAFIAGKVGTLTRSMQGGKVQYYFIYTLFGLILLVFWIIL